MDHEEAHEEIAYLRKRLDEERAQYEADIAMMNERLQERTDAMLNRLAATRFAPSAASFRDGWEASMNHYSIPSSPALEEAVQIHMNPKP